MTLIIAFVLMAHVEAHWIWYPVVFMIWLLHLAWHEVGPDQIKTRLKK
jgi:hypothetical protein